MIIYRAMCTEEFNETMKYRSLSWNSKFKWFGTHEFVTTRVQDGNFNNSRFVGDRYQHLVKFEVDDSCISRFSKCGYRELMLSRKAAPMVKFISMEDITGSNQ